MQPPTNVLHCGDNLDVLRRHVADASVDLAYLDPPFNSRQDYALLFGVKPRARPAPKAFGDTRAWDDAAAAAHAELVQAGGRLGEAMAALRVLAGEGDLLAYLAMMAPRLVELQRVLKPTGSVYLHCDPTASHYLRG